LRKFKTQLVRPTVFTGVDLPKHWVGKPKYLEGGKKK